MPRKRQGGSSIGRLTPSQKYFRNRHISRSRSRSSSSRMASQTQNQRMQDLDLDLALVEFLILQPEQNQDLGLLFKVCNMRPTNRETPGYRK